jgi:hypothetical protein
MVLSLRRNSVLLIPRLPFRFLRESSIIFISDFDWDKLGSDMRGSEICVFCNPLVATCLRGALNLPIDLYLVLTRI